MLVSYHAVGPKVGHVYLYCIDAFVQSRRYVEQERSFPHDGERLSVDTHGCHILDVTKTEHGALSVQLLLLQRYGAGVGGSAGEIAELVHGRCCPVEERIGHDSCRTVGRCREGEGPALAEIYGCSGSVDVPCGQGVFRRIGAGGIHIGSRSHGLRSADDEETRSVRFNRYDDAVFLLLCVHRYGVGVPQFHTAVSGEGGHAESVGYRTVRRVA